MTGIERAFGSRRGLRVSSHVMAAVLAGVLLLASAAEANRPPVYRAKMTFTQVRPWTYHHEQVSDGCVRTEDGNGLTVVKLHATGLLSVTNAARMYMVAVGSYRQTGTSTHTVSGAQCAASAVFPSTWRITTQTAGTVTATEPTDGCGTKSPKPSSSKVTLTGKHFVLEWAGDGGLEYDAFDPCPYFDGSNQATPGNALPGAAYRDIAAKVNRRALRSGARRVTAHGKSARSAVETCANIDQGCAEGATYEATATVTSTLKLALTRRRR